jgi:hypothetical protein
MVFECMPSNWLTIFHGFFLGIIIATKMTAMRDSLEGEMMIKRENEREQS